MLSRCARAASRTSDSSNSRRLAMPVRESRVASRSTSSINAAVWSADPVCTAACASARTVSTGICASSRPPHSAATIPKCSSSETTGATTTLRASGRSASSRPSSSVRTSNGDALDSSSSAGSVLALVSISDSTTPSSSTPHQPSGRFTSTTARVKPSRPHTCRTSFAMPSSARCDCSRSVLSSTSHSSCARLCRKDRSLTHEKPAAASANTRNVDRARPTRTGRSLSARSR